MSPVPAQMWKWVSELSTGADVDRGEPSPGADVAGVLQPLQACACSLQDRTAVPAQPQQVSKQKQNSPTRYGARPTDTLARPISFSRSLSETPSCVTLERGAIVRGAYRMYACTIRMHARMMYVCMHAGMRVCMPGRRACMHACRHACRYACMQACMRVFTHSCMHIGMHAGVLGIDLSMPNADWNAIGRSAATRRVDRWDRPSRPAVWQHVDSAGLHHVARRCNVSCGVCSRTRSYKDDDQPQLVERADLRVAQQLLDGRLRALHLQRAQRCDRQHWRRKDSIPAASQATDILKCGNRAIALPLRRAAAHALCSGAMVSARSC